MTSARTDSSDRATLEDYSTATDCGSTSGTSNAGVSVFGVLGPDCERLGDDGGEAITRFGSIRGAIGTGQVILAEGSSFENTLSFSSRSFRGFDKVVVNHGGNLQDGHRTSRYDEGLAPPAPGEVIQVTRSWSDLLIPPVLQGSLDPASVTSSPGPRAADVAAEHVAHDQ